MNPTPDSVAVIVSDGHANELPQIVSAAFLALTRNDSTPDEIAARMYLMGYITQLRAALSTSATTAEVPVVVGFVSQKSIDMLNLCRNDDYPGTVDLWTRPTADSVIPLYAAQESGDEQ